MLTTEPQPRPFFVENYLLIEKYHCLEASHTLIHIAFKFCILVPKLSWFLYQIKPSTNAIFEQCFLKILWISIGFTFTIWKLNLCINPFMWCDCINPFMWCDWLSYHVLCNIPKLCQYLVLGKGTFITLLMLSSFIKIQNYLSLIMDLKW